MSVMDENTRSVLVLMTDTAKHAINANADIAMRLMRIAETLSEKQVSDNEEINFQISAVEAKAAITENTEATTFSEEKLWYYHEGSDSYAQMTEAEFLAACGGSGAVDLIGNDADLAEHKATMQNIAGANASEENSNATGEAASESTHYSVTVTSAIFDTVLGTFNLETNLGAIEFDWAVQKDQMDFAAAFPSYDYSAAPTQLEGKSCQLWLDSQGTIMAAQPA